MSYGATLGEGELLNVQQHITLLMLNDGNILGRNKIKCK